MSLNFEKADDEHIGVTEELVMIVRAFKGLCFERGEEWVLTVAKRIFMKNVEDPFIFGDMIEQIIGHKSIDIIHTYSKCNHDTLIVLKYGVANLIAYSEKLAEKESKLRLNFQMQELESERNRVPCQAMEDIGQWMTQQLMVKFPNIFKNLKNPVVTEVNDVLAITDGPLIRKNNICSMGNN